jgi:hypothetical protein
MKHPEADRCVDLILMKMVPMESDHSDDASPRRVVITSEGEQIIDRLRPHPEQVEEFGDDPEREDVWLGRHTDMHSPGRIELHWQRLGSFFWHHLRDIQRHGYDVNQTHLYPLASLVVAKTLEHELFHHYADAISRITHALRAFPDEEALAVAWSHHELIREAADGRTNFGRLPRTLFLAMMERIFRYRGRGYRDWVAFQTQDAFERGIAAYLLDPAGEPLLRHNHINTPAVVKGMIAAIGMCGIEVRTVT